MPLAEYDYAVGPANQYFHEVAEMTALHKEGVLPLHDDDDAEGMAGADAVGDHGAPTFEDVATHGSPAKK